MTPQPQCHRSPGCLQNSHRWRSRRRGGGGCMFDLISTAFPFPRLFRFPQASPRTPPPKAQRKWAVYHLLTGRSCQIAPIVYGSLVRASPWANFTWVWGVGLSNRPPPLWPRLLQDYLYATHFSRFIGAVLSRTPDPSLSPAPRAVTKNGCNGVGSRTRNNVATVPLTIPPAPPNE